MVLVVQGNLIHTALITKQAHKKVSKKTVKKKSVTKILLCQNVQTPIVVRCPCPLSMGAALGMGKRRRLCSAPRMFSRCLV